MAALLDHADDAAIIAAALEGFRTEPIAGVRNRATVRVLGEIEAPAAPVIAPVSGVRCAAYDVVIRARGDVLHRARSSALFAIKESSGDRAVVEPTHAQVRVLGRTLTTRRGDAVTPELAALLARAGDRVADRWTRADELVLATGDAVVVVGAAIVELDRDDDRRIDSYRGLAPTRLRLGGTAEYPVMISTDPGDIAASRQHLAARW